MKKARTWTPESMFDCCHETYVRLKFSGMSAVPLEIIGAPALRGVPENIGAQYCAHFEMAGREALATCECGHLRVRHEGLVGHCGVRGRTLPDDCTCQAFTISETEPYRFFLLFFCERMILKSDPHEIWKAARMSVQDALKLREGRFNDLYERVRAKVGKELERRQLFPPSAQLSKSYSGKSINSELREANLL